MTLHLNTLTGYWDAAANRVRGSATDRLGNIQGPSPLRLYEVVVAGSTDLNGINDWRVGDYAFYNGFNWARFVGSRTAGGGGGNAGLEGYTPATVLELISKAAITLVPTTSLWEAQDFAPITYSAAPVINGNAGINFKITLEGDCAFQPPVGMKPGQSGIIKITQDTAGNRKPTWAGVFNWGSGGAPVLSVGGGKADYLTYFNDADLGQLVMGLFNKAAA